MSHSKCLIAFLFLTVLLWFQSLSISLGVPVGSIDGEGRFALAFTASAAFFKAAGSVEIEAFPLFCYSRRRRRRHSFSFFGFGKALCLETTFAISQLLPTHQGNFRNLLSLASSFFCANWQQLTAVWENCGVYAKDEKYAVQNLSPMGN